MPRTSTVGPAPARVVALALALASSGCAPAPHAPAAARAASAPPPLVVTLVVDQLAAWIARERWPLLPASGGFARLAREGTWLEEVHYAHAATDTAPGHAALYTGATPRESGVVTNERIDEASGGRVSVLRDAGTTVIDGDGIHADLVGSSIALLQVDTVADRLRAARRDAVIVSLSLKDRGALFAGGRTPTASVWFDPKRDRFVTSSAVGTSFPRWAVPPTHPAAWELADAAWVGAHALTPDAQDGEGDVDGFGTVFPHRFAASKSPGYAFRTTPFADEALLAMALAAIDAEKAREHASLVAISLSANDYIGHTFGPDSWEAWDELLRLDAALARFFAALDARVGPAGWAAVLTADHGVTTMPEAAREGHARPWCAAGRADRWERACGSVGRILPDELAASLRASAERALGKGSWVAGVADPYVTLTEAARALDPSRMEVLRAALTRTLLERPEIERVYDVRALPRACPADADESVDALVCRGTRPSPAPAAPPGGASPAGDLYVVTRAGSFFDPSVVVGKGTSHGSPHLFDRAVPLLARAPGRIAAGRVVETPASFRTFARTVASLLGIDPPVAARSAPDLVRSAP